MTRQTAGQIVRSARLRAGLTVRSLAPRVIKANGNAVVFSYITDIEKGRGIPSDSIARQLAAALDIDEAELIAACKRDRSRRDG